ncbi:MAG: DUF3105 domain-containing protein [Acidimicrobiia bacterium]|nr:DUF3105 domain-containing protein [Acidimicrobiia bacterium]
MGNTPKVRKVSDRRPAPGASRSAPGAAASSRWVRYAAGFGALALVGLLVWFVSRDVTSNPQGAADPPAGTESFVIGEVAHTPGSVDYEQDPPAGGSHDATWLTCAAYDTPVRNEYAVHALEHGAIWITYQPELDAAAIDDLEGYARRSEVIVSPYPGLDSPIVLSAWGRQLRLDAVDDAVIDQFYRAFRDKTAPEPGASC